MGWRRRQMRSLERLRGWLYKGNLAWLVAADFDVLWKRNLLTVIRNEVVRSPRLMANSVSGCCLFAARLRFKQLLTGFYRLQLSTSLLLLVCKHQSSTALAAATLTENSTEYFIIATSPTCNLAHPSLALPPFWFIDHLYPFDHVFRLVPSFTSEALLCMKHLPHSHFWRGSPFSDRRGHPLHVFWCRSPRVRLQNRVSQVARGHDILAQSSPQSQYCDQCVQRHSTTILK
jgi:hypothetical protein